MTDVSPTAESTSAPTVQPASLENQVGQESQSMAECSGEWAAFVAAVQFLTRVQLSTGSVSAAALARCPVYFPLVGTLIGVFSAITLGFACLFWPVWLSVIVILALEARATGAFHEDAVADFCDAFGGGWAREDVLRILKDSRIGTFGALGLGLAVALRAGATIEIMHQYGPENWLVWSTAIVASSAIGRLAIVVVMLCVPPIGSRESLSRDIGIQLSRWDLLKACLWTLPAAMPFAVLLPIRALLSVVVVALITIWFMRLVRHRLGGITGDCLGCIGYCSHVVVLLVTTARWQL